MTKVLSFKPTGKPLRIVPGCVGKLIFNLDLPFIRCNRRSTSVYMVQVCDSRGTMGPANDGKVEGEYEQPLDLCRFALQEVVAFHLTPMKAALFTAIVTAFVLDAMSDLDEDTATKLLRLLVEQSVANSTVEVPPSNPPSSIVTVSSLWFLSIMSSLAATTWAMLCLEWCAFLTDGVQAEDYEEMAEKRQRKFEAVKRWKMHLVVAAIPFFLHLSLFLFLAGLWLRLRDVNKQLGLIVGVPGLIIASSYVVVTLLPIFTKAPFSTSASELIQPVADWFMRVARLSRSIRFPRIARLLSMGSSLLARASSHLPRLKTYRFRVFAELIYKIFKPYIRTAWKTIALIPIIPTFGSERNPFDELGNLKVGRSDRDKGIHLRALFWLMNTPLGKDEVKDVLNEFKNLGETPGERLDRTIIRLLVLSLSSILENNHVSDDEQPIFDHCTTVLAQEMDREFGDREHDRIVFRKTRISKQLLPHFHLITPDEDAPSAYPGKIYWSRAIPALWLCPSEETIRSVVGHIDLYIQLIEQSDLRPIVRGLHAATLACFSPSQSTFDLIPDFSRWSWDSGSPDKDLDVALSSFLQGLFAAFFNTLQRSDNPITTQSLIVDCLKVLDDQPERYNLQLHSALCFLVAVMWRSEPEAFGGGSPIADALLESAESYKEYSGEGESKRAKILVTRLRAIAYGPKPLISRQTRSLKSLGDLYDGPSDSIRTIRTDQQCLEGLLDANAAILEATLAVDGNFTIFVWKRSPDYEAARSMLSNSLYEASFDFVLEHPNYRLPYLYSLAIALSYTTEGRNEGLWKFSKLLVTHEEQVGMTTDRALDTNILVVTLLRFIPYNRTETMEGGWKGNLLERLQKTVMDGTDWRTRWKSIYLIASLMFLLSQMDDQPEGDEQTKFLVDAAGRSFEQVKHKGVPSGWERKRKGLKLCKLEAEVKSLASTRGEASEMVYKWCGENVPYLSLYNPQRSTPEPISRAAFWAVMMLHR